MTRGSFTAAILIVALGASAPAMFGKDDGGGSGGGGKLQRTINLAPTPVGARHNASGTASWRIQGNNQRFKVDFDIDVPNGAVFLIEVDGSTVGLVAVSFDEAEFEIEGEDGHPLPPPLNPLTQIKQVSVVSSSGTTVVQGSF